MRTALPSVFAALALSGLSCTDDGNVNPVPDAGVPDTHDAGPDAGEGGGDAGAAGHFCDLPGSLRFTDAGTIVVPGGPSAPDMTYLHLPAGFCAHYFAHVGNARQLRFAPGGELFVASPTTVTTGGGSGGLAAIVLLPDDNKDGAADSTITFLKDIPSTQGLLFTKDQFYYQDATRIMKLPYAAGDRAPSAAGVEVANITIYFSSLHWPKTLDEADDGTIYVANGGDEGEMCDPARPFHGGILKLDGSPGGTPVAKGFRNPIAVRCSRGKNLCFAAELAKDYSANEGGREKLVPIRQGDDWGFPCCATKDLPYQDVIPAPDCSKTVPEDASFVIGNTPFSFDFDAGKWPAPWTNSVFVPLHGAAGSWAGARVVAIAIDPATGMPVPSNDFDGGSAGGMTDFATGWDDGTLSHGRPAAITFHPDGRMFLSNDNNGDIVWIAPFDL